MELARETSHACPFDSRVEEEIVAPALRSQSESFLSASERAWVSFPAGVKAGLPSFERPGVEGTDRADLCLAPRRWVLDLLFGRERWAGLRSETRDEDRERIEGVVGAERPSI